MDEELLGSIKLFAGNFIPEGYVECNGQLLSVGQYQAVYAILGNTYGGNYATNFAVPKMTPPMDGMKYIMAVRGIFPSRQ